MGKSISKPNCCGPDQMSSNLTLSAEAERLSHSMDDEPILSSSSLDESRGEPPSIAMKLTFASNYVQLAEEPQEWPVCLSVSCGEQAIEERQGMDVVVLIETSMHSHPKSELIKSSLEFLMSRLNGQDRLSLVSFHDSSTRLCPLTSMTYTGKVKVGMAMRNLRYFGSCDVVEGLIFALSVLNNRRNSNANSNILVFASGNDNNPHSVKERISDVLHEFSLRINTGFSVHLFAVSEPSTILNYIAEETNGYCYFSVDERSFLENVGFCCGVMESKIAEDLAVNIVLAECSVPMIISKVYSENSETCFRLPELLAGSSVDTVFLIKFLHYTGQEFKSLEVVKVLVNYKVKGVGFFEELVLRVPIFSPEKVCREIEIDEEVLVHFYRVKTADIMNEVAEIKGHSLESAHHLLEKALSELQESCVANHHLLTSLALEIRGLSESLSASEASKAVIRNRARAHWAKRCADLVFYHNSSVKINKNRLKALLKLGS